MGRRNFVEVVGNFPSECRYVLETLGGVYANDAATKERKMTPAERLEFHQQHSQPLMEGLKEWMEEQFRNGRWSRTRGWARRSRICKSTGASSRNFCASR